MEAVITAITAQKKNTNRFNIFINHQYAFSLGRDLAQTLIPGDLISESAIEALKQMDEKEAAFARAIYYLNFRPRSRQEIKRYLTKKKFSPQAVTQALTRLENCGYINDKEFARLWVVNRCRLKPKGAYVLKGELREKGIDEKLIKAVLADIDETQSAWGAVASRLFRMKPDGRNGSDRREFDKKILGFLSRRGFSWDVCRTICDRAWEEIGKEAND